MATIDWNAAFQGLDPAWRVTRGAGVRLALLDSGADLTRPELRHLGGDGFRFDVTRPDFAVGLGQLAGKDPVLGVDSHGTQLLAVLAARPGAGGDAPTVQGLAPDATVFIIKIANPGGQVTQRFFLRGLELALRLEADVIVTGQTPMLSRVPGIDAAIERIFHAVLEQRALFVAPAFNTDRLEDLIRFPADRPEGVVAAALLDKLLASFPADRPLGRPDFVLPEALQLEPGETVPCSCSIAAACLAGAATLLIAHWKKTEGTSYRRRTRDEVIAALQSIALPFSAGALHGQRSAQFLTPHLQHVP
jgi:hypothetical protein